MNNDENKSFFAKAATFVLALALAVVVYIAQGGLDDSQGQSGIVAGPQGTGTSQTTVQGNAPEASELTYYPAQTGVDPANLTVYGEPVGVPASVTVTKGNSYTSRDEVALYIHLYGRVPPNYVSKTKARDAGWVAEEGNLQDVLPGKSIGGGGWFNDELAMPGSSNIGWHECDINYQGGFRGPERLVYSDEGLIFYTPDHYVSYARIF